MSWGFFRIGALISFIFFWPQMVRLVGKQRGLSEMQIKYFEKQQWLIAIWLLIFDLIVVENIFQYI